MHSFYAIATLATVVAVLALAAYYWKFKGLSEEEALKQAVRMAWKFWQIYSFKMPGLLVNASISRQDLIEAGLVLRSLVVGEVADGAVSHELSRPHPELARVDPLHLAEEVSRRAQYYESTGIMEGSHG